MKGYIQGVYRGIQGDNGKNGSTYLGLRSLRDITPREENQMDN